MFAIFWGPICRLLILVIWRHQTQTLLLMPRSTCWQESGMSVPWPIQMQILIGNHLTEHEDTSERAGGRTEGAEGGCIPIGRAISTNWTTPCSKRLNHQPKSIHGGIHGSRYICSRGWPYLTWMREEALGPVEASCPSIGHARRVRQELVVGWRSTLLEAKARKYLGTILWGGHGSGATFGI